MTCRQTPLSHFLDAGGPVIGDTTTQATGVGGDPGGGVDCAEQDETECGKVSVLLCLSHLETSSVHQERAACEGAPRNGGVRLCVPLFSSTTTRVYIIRRCCCCCCAHKVCTSKVYCCIEQLLRCCWHCALGCKLQMGRYCNNLCRRRRWCSPVRYCIDHKTQAHAHAHGRRCTQTDDAHNHYIFYVESAHAKIHSR